MQAHRRWREGGKRVGERRAFARVPAGNQLASRVGAGVCGYPVILYAASCWRPSGGRNTHAKGCGCRCRCDCWRESWACHKQLKVARRRWSTGSPCPAPPTGSLSSAALPWKRHRMASLQLVTSATILVDCVFWDPPPGPNLGRQLVGRVGSGPCAPGPRDPRPPPIFF